MNVDDGGGEGTAGRRFRSGGEEWIARVEGQGVAGSDAIADRAIQIVSFAREAEPERVVRRALTSLRPLDVLFDEELEALLVVALPVDDSAEGQTGHPASGRGRRRGGPLDAGPDDRPGSRER